MGYYASGSGQLVMKEGCRVPYEVVAELGRIFSEVADSPDGGMWITFEHDHYHEDKIDEALKNLAPFVKSGNINFQGENNEKWRFHFLNGEVREQGGRTVYEDIEADLRHENRMQMIACIIDAFEDWLIGKGITKANLPNEDCDDDDDNDALIYGMDFAEVSERIENALIECDLLEEE